MIICQTGRDQSVPVVPARPHVPRGQGTRQTAARATEPLLHHVARGRGPLRPSLPPPATRKCHDLHRG